MLITERYKDQIHGVLSCYDRVVLRGTLPGWSYAQGMTSFLYANQIRIFDYPSFAQPLRGEIRDNAEQLAAENGLEIEHIRKIKAFRKEDRIQDILKERGTHPGLVHIFSAMESCSSYKPWHDRRTGKTFLKHDTAKCLPYYFYFIDPELGLCYLRVPTWCPFQLQFYFNMHNWLATKLNKHSIPHVLNDNTFLEIGEDCITGRTPVNRSPFSHRQAIFIKLQEYPLGPSVVVGIAGSNFMVPVILDTQSLYGSLKALDVIVDPDLGMGSGLDGRIFCWQTEGIPSHRMKNIVSLPPSHSIEHVPDHIVFYVTHVGLARRVRKHFQKIVFAALCSTSLLFPPFPDPVPLLFYLSMIISVTHSSHSQHNYILQDCTARKASGRPLKEGQNTEEMMSP
ncbi:hypothetical protein HKBW3S03_00648 [Candidatus Hakubella thermalkaliphila]|uniref:Uncharacterized protein n=1 Tax=Candidatus Hakubella thermalkaliphila TaxID=2754717 RepID=A0A6V8NIE0_9ACTN|nr:hypothetical protein HKBW3S03_00648 [Candidatus Hakubella thermalkaliphila]